MYTIIFDTIICLPFMTIKFYITIQIFQIYPLYELKEFITYYIMDVIISLSLAKAAVAYQYILYLITLRLSILKMIYRKMKLFHPR